jgi:hypothetical protein|tara:strand:- start:2565 stop:2996 length:432 start_codon:yes stop_codon:yes gene_type:complete
MAITQAMCTSFKVELLKGVHNLTASTGNTINMALYQSTASLDATTTAYTTSGEASGTGYTAKGAALTSVTPVASGTTAVCDFADLTFSSVSITARGGMIFNETATGDPSLVILDFGADKTATAGDMTITFPTASATAAIIRIA